MLTLAIVGGISLIGGYLLLNNSDKNSENPTVSSTSQQPTTSPSDNPTGTSGKYLEYNQELVAQTDGTKILFFHAPWCPQCRQLEASIKENTIPENVTIFKVDYDSNQALRQKYGVTIQTTLVKIDDQGNEVEKFVAYEDPSLDTVIKELL